uniref:Uncharacterized protein n=1 Tax=Vitrella brassicaformis TaxID=1169539 RepID=A0A7S1P9G5_9ALVE
MYGRSMDLWRFATSGCRFWRMSSDPRKWERAVDVFVLDVHVGLLSEFAAIVIPGVMQTILGSFTPALFPGLIQLGRTECPPKQALAALLVQLTIEIFTACATLVIYDRGGFPVKWRRCLDQPWKFYGSLCVWVCFIFFWILWASGDIVAQNSTNSMPSWMAGRD